MRRAIPGLAAAMAFLGAGALAEDDDATASPVTRVVTVTAREDGKPLAGATVEAIGADGAITVKAVDANGVARFVNFPRKGVTFVARAPGRYRAWHEPGMWWWSQPPEDEDPDGDGVTTFGLAMSKGGAFDGSVVALADGAPIAGATIDAWERTSATDVPHLDCAPAWSVASAEDGRFRTDRHFPEGASLDLVHARITARAPGWISESVDVAPSGARAAVFRLRPAATLHGVVTDADGAPVAGAAVHAYPADFGLFHRGDPAGARHDEDEHPRVLHARTDAEGRYAMTELHPGTSFFVYAERLERPPDEDWGDGDPVARSEVVPGVTAAAGADAVCDLRVRRFASLLVRGAPKRARIDLDAPPRSLPWTEEAATEDGAHFTELLPGRAVVRADANGFLPAEVEVELREGERSEVTLALETGAAIAGVVVDDRGVAVPGARVGAYVGSGPRRFSRDAAVDASGAFEVRGLRDGAADLWASAEGHFFDDELRVDVPSSGVRIVLVREAKVRVLLAPPPGAALPAKVRTTVKLLAGRYAGLVDPREVPPEDFPAVLDRVRPGPVEVTVDLPGFAPATLRADVAAGETADVGPFAFDAGVAVAGVVVDAEGNPLAGVRVTPDESDARAVTTGPEGEFEVPHLARGRVHLAFVAEGFPETHVVAATGGDGAPHRVVLSPGGTARGRAASPPDDLVTRRRLCIFEEGAPNGFVPHWHAEVDVDLRWSLRLPAGRYRYVPSRYDFGRGHVVFEVREGEETRLDVSLR